MDKLSKKFSSTLNSLNIADYEGRCLRHLFLNEPKKQKAFAFLRILTAKIKKVTERNGVECDLIVPATRFLKDLPSSLLVNMSDSKKLKYMYYKEKLLGFLKSDTIFKEYVDKFIERTATTTFSRSEFEILLNKFVKVCKKLRSRPELSNQDVHHYELTANLLKLCYDLNVQNSKLVIDILKITIDWYVGDTLIGPVRQPCYPDGFLKYILGHSITENFDLQLYCIEHPRTLWEFSNKFSVINAVASGNKNITLCLLQYGIEVFTEKEIYKASQRFPFISAYLPISYLITLHTLDRIHSVNHLIQSLNRTIHHESDDIFIKDQKECFNILWRSITEPFVKASELQLALTAEFLSYDTGARIENAVRYRKIMELCDTYEASFANMALGPKEPRSLKHLSLCAIRKRLGQVCLPEEVKNLGLPGCLEDCLNLERD